MQEQTINLCKIGTDARLDIWSLFFRLQLFARFSEPYAIMFIIMLDIVFISYYFNQNACNFLLGAQCIPSIRS